MTTAPVSADPSRMPWAKVAASGGKENLTLASFATIAASTPTRDSLKENKSLAVVSQDRGQRTVQPTGQNGQEEHNYVADQVGSAGGRLSNSGEGAPAAEALQAGSESSLVLSVEALNFNEPMPSLVVNGSGTTATTSKSESIDGFSEDAFNRVDSESELGTKPPSLDGKSITSGTTFALDEKESLRPDDSASVKAAEDDDTFSGRGSIVAGSRIGSEAAARAYRSQMYDTNDRRNILPMQERQHPGIITPQSGSSGQQVSDEIKPQPLVGVDGTPDAFNLFYRQTPDEKLLEALESSKDRIFLLRLEQEVIQFVKNSQEPFIDLPPCNSFCRMLTHKLADYYHMTHQVDTAGVAGSIRIFRTPFCRLPPPLQSISNPPTNTNTPPPTLPAMKIMRRGGDGDTGPSPSKTTSETGSDGKDKNSLSAKEKLSREEREAAYNKARERIFGNMDEKTSDGALDTEDGNEMSRSSSVSNKDKSGQVKKNKPAKQRRDDSGDFDPRSQYTPYYPPQQTPTWVPGPQYSPMVPQQFNSSSQIYQNQMPQQFVPPNMQYNQSMMNNGTMQPYNTMPAFPQQNQGRAQPYSAPMTAYGSPVQSPPILPQQWPQQSMYQPAYIQQPPPQQPRGPMVGGSQNSIPYQYGQLPSTINPADPKSQHPIPGSFNRHAFNPKTHPFVPGSTGLPVPQSVSHHGSPHLTYNSYTPPQQKFSNGTGYGMVRQGSNNSLPSYHASPHMAHRTMMHPGNQSTSHGMGPGAQFPSGMQVPPPQVMQGMPHGGQIGNHLPAYGNPATLPPKPPTGV
ncbi:hypothetical protein B0O99DRAFT_620436 [Bisporella sp. PMI_857]|nr:hypothetical protein B0O99DRAFT_620436 [Bisporella sp. PMI_857]